MDDINIIRKLEKIINKKLYGLHDISWRSRGYLKNSQGRITGLSIFDANLTDLHPVTTLLKKLTKLRILNLGGNNISDLSPLEELVNIISLDLSYNQIVSIQPLAHLTQISTLNLSYNYIHNLEPLKNHIQLSKVDLSHNQIVDLSPLQKSALHSNLHPSIDKNPIQTPPPEIIQRGEKSINNYLAQLAKQAEDYIFEAKMLIVGEPGAGKTSLTWKIENENCTLPDSQNTTKGIDVKPYKFTLSKDEVSNLTKGKKNEKAEFRLNLWDFGGQEIYKATHRFFLSKRSLYTLLADSRNEDTDFNYWLHIVEMFGGNSPLLIVLNEKFQRKKTIDIPAMKARFGNIVDVLPVDLADDDKSRLHQVAQAIRYNVMRLPHIGSPVPAKWTVIRDALEGSPNNTISLRQYLEFCAKNEIDKVEDALVLSQYFHDIGVFLHFQDDPLLKNTIFLNNTWATNAVYQILDDPLLNRKEGRFSKADAITIWNTAEFAILRDELLQLMKKFFLTYEIGNTGEYLVPERLPSTQPTYEWPKHDNLILQYKYDFFMPRGILSQLIVRMNNYIHNHSLVWKRGVVLIRKGAGAEITESYDARNIKIRISGKNRHDFMTIISENIDQLNAQYEKMKVEKLIPCNCAECNNSETPYFYEYKKLTRRLENNILTILCEESYKEVNVKTLLDDVINERKKAGRFNKREKIFISYSHKDSKWLERVQVHLKGLRHLEIDAQAWDDTQIQSGMKWYKEIKGALAQSQAAILLISADFLASDFIANEELPELLKTAKNNGLTILPVIVKPSLFGKTKLGAFQAVNNPSKPLAGLSVSEQDAELVKLAERVAELVG